METAFPKLTIVIPFWSRRLPWWRLATSADAPVARRELRQALLACVERFSSILHRSLDPETQQPLTFEILVAIPGAENTHRSIRDAVREPNRDLWAQGNLKTIEVTGRPEEATWFRAAAKAASGTYIWFVDPSEEWSLEGITRVIHSLHGVDLLLLCQRPLTSHTNLLGLALQDRWIADSQDRLFYASGMILKNQWVQRPRSWLQALLEALAEISADRVQVLYLPEAMHVRHFQALPKLIEQATTLREMLISLKNIPRSRWIALFRPSALALLPNRR